MSFLNLETKDMARPRDLLQMANRLESLHDSGEYSDFVVKCESREFKLHKAIVCPQSGFFKRLCNPQFKEGSQGEATLQETDATLLEQALRFLYTGDYHDELGKTSSADEGKVDSQTTLSNGNETSPSNVSGSAVGLPDNKEMDDDTVVEEVVAIGMAPDGRVELARQDDHPRLLSNIRMYILADYLEISLLKQEALDRCTVILENEFEPARLIGPLQYGLENTASGEGELRSTIFRLCSEQRAKVIACSKLDELLAREEPIAWKLLKDQQLKHSESLEERDKEISRRAAELLSLALEIEDLKRELDESASRVRRKDSRLNECIRLTQRWSECRNCAVDFDCEIERHRGTGDYFLRCKRCRCRHDEF